MHSDTYLIAAFGSEADLDTWLNTGEEPMPSSSDPEPAAPPIGTVPGGMTDVTPPTVADLDNASPPVTIADTPIDSSSGQVGSDGLPEPTKPTAISVPSGAVPARRPGH